MEGAVQFEYTPEDETVNHHCYAQVLKRVRLAFCRKRPKKGESRAWTFMYHDNAMAHTAHFV